MEMENKDEIIDGNELIAEFMGMHYNAKYKLWCRQEDFTLADGEEYAEELIKVLQFDKSWDLLFPVIEKIGAMSFNESKNMFRPTVDRFIENDKESIWKQVVEFIRWYNAKQ